MRLPPARATTAIVAITCIAWAIVGTGGLADRAAVLGGFIPARFGTAPDLAGAVPAILTPLSATLLHSGIVHLALNMLMLGFCGRYVEAAVGARPLVLLYVVGAYAAAGGQYLAGPNSFTPMIGASGAASALLGAYALLYGQQRTGAGTGRKAHALQVLWLAAGWIFLQLLVEFAGGFGGAAIATAAHVGGFLCGLALARPLLLWRYRKA